MEEGERKYERGRREGGLKDGREKGEREKEIDS